jgi:hypothetical protein
VTRLAAAVGLALLAGVLAPPPGKAQSPQVAVLADTIHVGDVVPVAVRLTVPAGHRVTLPPLVPLGDREVENATRVQERHATLPDGSLQVTGIYSITPWRPGTTELPGLELLVHDPDDGTRTVVAWLPSLDVSSVLTGDPDQLDPRPAKDVLGRSFAWWPFVLLLALILALAALALWWVRRRRAAAGPTAAPVPAVHPRERALAALRDARRAGLVERGEWKEFYTRVALALRVYLEEMNAEWSEDLTTTEVLARVRNTAGPEAARDLAAALRPADQVKFARREPDASEAAAEWEMARRWVEAFHWPPPDGLEAAA